MVQTILSRDISPKPIGSLGLPSDPRAVRTARNWISNVLTGWHANVIADSQRMVSELVANAVIHVSIPGIGIDAAISEGVPLVRVHDRSPILPVLRRAESLDTSGRGLWVVDILAKWWGSEPRSWGKTVWFVPRMPAEPMTY